jgi:hypothetical protein
MEPLLILSLAPFTIMTGAIAWRPFKRWLRKVRRRRGGVYLWRVRHHLHAARRVNGYVGETNSFHFRRQQHLGVSRFDPVTGRAVKGTLPGVATVKVPAQPWSDLDPVMRQVIKLPWWLCWKWVLRPLETLVMLLTWPVYNDAKNRWNPRRIPRSLAKIQRARRDAGAAPYRVTVAAGRALVLAYRVAGVALVFAGLFGWAATR